MTAQDIRWMAGVFEKLSNYNKRVSEKESNEFLEHYFKGKADAYRLVAEELLYIAIGEEEEAE